MSEQSLKLKIQADISNLKKGMADAGKEVSGFKDKMGKVSSSVGSGFKTIAKGAAAVTGAVAATGAGLFAMASKAASAGDVIHKGSSKIGVTTKAYQEMDYWASQNGLSSGDMEKTVGRLNQRIGMALEGNEKYSNALEATGVSMDGLRNGTISTEDAFATSIQTLSGMEDGHQKVALATELFGSKLARELLPALEDGSLSFEDAKKKAEELGIVLDEDSVNASAAFSDSMDDLQRSMGAVFTKIGIQLMPMFQSMMDWVIANMPAIQAVFSKVFEVIGKVVQKAGGIFKDYLLPALQNVVEWVTSNWPTIQTVIEGVFSGIQAVWNSVLKPVLDVIMEVVKQVADNWNLWKVPLGILVGLFTTIAVAIAAYNVVMGIMTAVTTAWSAVTTIATAVGGAFAAVIAFITSPIGLVIAAIAALIAIGVLLYKNWDKVKEVAGKVWDGVKKVFTAMWEGIKKIFAGIADTMGKAMEKAKEIVIKIITAIKDSYVKLFNAVKDFVVKVFNGIKDAMSKAMEAAKTIITTIINAIKSVFETIFNAIKKVVETVFNAIKKVIETVLNVVKEVTTKILNVYKKLFETIFNAIKKVVETVFNAMKQVIETVMNVIKEVVTRLLNAYKQLFETIFNAVKTIVTTVFNAIKSVIETVMNTIKTVVTTILNAIKTVFTTIFNAIKTVVQTVFNAIKDVMSNTMETAKNTVVNAVNAIKNGFSNGLNAAKNTVTNIFNSIRDTIKNVMDTASNTVKGAIDKIKGFFKFEWSLPKLKMPSFSIDGKFSLNPPSVPKFGISWNARGAIFKKPTVLGNGQGVGDASNGFGSAPEVVAPLSDLKQMLGLNGGGGQTVNIYSPTALNPSETARLQKRASKQMALGWG